MLLSKEGDRPLKDDALVLGTFFLVATLLCLCLKGWANYYLVQSDLMRLQRQVAYAAHAAAKQPKCDNEGIND